MKSKILGLLAVGLLAGPMAANAGLITYEFNGSGSGVTVSGAVVLDEADALPSVNLVPVFTSWYFTWTDGSLVGSSDSTDSIFAFADFQINALGIVSGVNLCTNACSTGNLTDILVYTTGFTASWPDADGQRLGTGEWSGPKAVPEPGTLALLGLGLAGLGLSRRRKA